jgi:hypothetical protein
MQKIGVKNIVEENKMLHEYIDKLEERIREEQS